MPHCKRGDPGKTSVTFACFGDGARLNLDFGERNFHLNQEEKSFPNFRAMLRGILAN